MHCKGLALALKALCDLGPITSLLSSPTALPSYPTPAHWPPCGLSAMTSHTHTSGLFHLQFSLPGMPFSQIPPWLDSSLLPDLGLKYHLIRGLSLITLYKGAVPQLPNTITLPRFCASEHIYLLDIIYLCAYLFVYT